MNPAYLINALDYLKQNNIWDEDIAINRDTKSFDSYDVDEQDQVKTSDDDGESRQIAIDSCLQPVDFAQEVLDHYFDYVFNIAPAEGNNPIECYKNHETKQKHFRGISQAENFHWTKQEKRD